MSARAFKALVALMAVFIAGVGASHAATIMVTSPINADETWTPDNEYILTEVVYVTNGATLTIRPGTVIRGEQESAVGAFDPGTLVVTRGSKIRSLGTKEAPVVFTDLMDDNIGSNPGSAPYAEALDARQVTGQWGGVIVLGRTYVANDTLAGPDAAREVQIEGLESAGTLGFYGDCMNQGAFPDCDDDDSGVIRYTSIRYGGFNLAADNEINGLTLGAVGRGTDIDYVEVMQNKDDGIEFFGGTVEVKHAIVYKVGDDSFDYDEGYRGKIQFGFAVQGTPGTDKSDKGAEQDGGNSPDGSRPFAIPTWYNMTFVGLGQKDFTDSDTNSGLHFRDNAGGRQYNSFYGDFGGATVLIEGGNTGGSSTGPLTSGERSVTAYPSLDAAFHLGPASDFELELQDTVFWCFGRQEDIGGTGALQTGDASAYGSSGGKEHHDNGLFTNAALSNDYLGCNAALPIRALDRFMNPIPTIPDQIQLIDPRPADGSPLLTTDRMPPNDGFFWPAPYKGAFDDKNNWAAGWSTMWRLGLFPEKPEIQVTDDIGVDTVWTQDNVYVLTEPIYVTDGATLTIEAGTVVRGETESAVGANDPGTLIVARGSKIDAQGTEKKPIVFTNLDDDALYGVPGTFPYDNASNARSVTGTWGGVIILGRTYVANDTLAGPNAAREVQIEGLEDAGSLGFYGDCMNQGAFPDCDDDDSGQFKYVSIRYGGFNLAADNEINGLTLGAVGRGTAINHVEIFQNKDDGVEFFGGTVDVRNALVFSVGDDGFDYDEGFRGSIQYGAVFQGTPGTDKSDKGAEQDGGNSPDGSRPFAIPTFFNMTFIGLGQKDFTDSDTNSGLHFRDNAGGRQYNSFYGDFGGATVLIEGGNTGGSSTGPLTSGERSVTAYPSVDAAFHTSIPSSFELELQNTCFWCFGRQEDIGGTGALQTGDASAYGSSGGKEHHDNGLFTDASLMNEYQACAAALPLRNLDREIIPIPTIPNPILTIDPRPLPGSSLLGTPRLPPQGSGFKASNFKGAFSSTDNWASGWTNMDTLGYFPDCDTTLFPNSIPNCTKHFKFNSKVLAKWHTPLGDNWTGFDLLRKSGTTFSDAADFSTATCVETADTDDEASVTDVPGPGGVNFYLLRVVNDCGGNMGEDSSGTARTGGATCP